MLDALLKDLKAQTNPEKAQFLKRYFKTGKGEYAEGDVFLGLTVPQTRKLALIYKELPLLDIEKLLASKVHEERQIALMILVRQFSKADSVQQKVLYEFYLDHTRFINNWDLVDLSAEYIVGEYLLTKPTNVLVTLAQSQNLWERRMAIIATFAFIKQGKHHETFKIAEILLTDKHDLIHKAVGGMLREVGKRISKEVEEEFLQKQYKKMPRTMLRYSLEHFPEEKRKHFMAK